jgi:four helix bundle protein
MCLGIPGKVLDTYREHDVLMGRVDFGGVGKQCTPQTPPWCRRKGPAPRTLFTGVTWRQNPKTQAPTSKQNHKAQIATPKQIAMGENQNSKPYDLEERTFEFAKHVRAFVKLLPRTVANVEDVRQVIRSSGSVGANYIEANEALGKKDFVMRIKISRKEAKETRYWLRLLDTGADARADGERGKLIEESTELLRILSAILRKTEGQARPL